MKKRTLVLLGTTAMLSLALASSIGAIVTVSASSITQDSNTGTTEVTYQVKDSWEVTIPESIEVGGDGQNVEAKNVKIAPDHELNVAVKSQNGWKVTEGGTADGTGIEYELKKGGDGTALQDDDNVLTVEAGTATGSETLTATVKSGNENYSTGNEEYSDTLTFTVTSDEKGA